MIDNIDDLRHPPRYKYRITLPAWGRRIESLLIVRMPWFEPFEMAGLFAVHARPVPLAAPRVGSVTEFHTIEMPAGFAGYGLPLERSERCPWATYSCQVYADAARLHCERRVQFLGGIVAPVDFGEFKRFWEACVRWDGEDIVLVQNSSPLACVSGELSLDVGQNWSRHVPRPSGIERLNLVRRWTRRQPHDFRMQDLVTQLTGAQWIVEFQNPPAGKK